MRRSLRAGTAQAGSTDEVRGLPLAMPVVERPLELQPRKERLVNNCVISATLAGAAGISPIWRVVAQHWPSTVRLALANLF